MNPELRKIDDLASDWVLRRELGLPPGEAKALELWKEADPRHAEALSRHEEAWALLDRQREAGRAAELVRDLAGRSSRRRRRRVALAAAAGVALLATGWLWQSRQVAGASPPVASAVLLPPEKRTLPDGSVVELRRGAEIAVDFSGPLRRVALRRGEALFQVAKNKERPFVVSAGGIEVRAVGTAFVVQLEEREMDVVVTEGRVRVGRAPGPADSRGPDLRPAAGNPALFLDAGHHLTVDLRGEAASLPIAASEPALSPQEIADRLSWRAPRVEFSETPLGEAVSLMNRGSAEHLVIGDPTLAAIRVNGLFRADDSATFVRLLEANFGVAARQSGNVVTLRFAPR